MKFTITLFTLALSLNAAVAVPIEERNRAVVGANGMSILPSFLAQRLIDLSAP
jgi:hypothetical protein